MPAMWRQTMSASSISRLAALANDAGHAGPHRLARPRRASSATSTLPATRANAWCCFDGDRHPLPERAEAQVANDMFLPHRHERGLTAPGWGHRGAAHPIARAGGERRLERLHQFRARHLHGEPGRQQLHPRQRVAGDDGLARCAEAGTTRYAWFDAPDLNAQKQVARESQDLQAFQDVPYWPTGMFFQATAYRKWITGVLKGFPLFYNVRRA